VTEAFEGGKIFNKDSLFKNKRIKNSLQTFFTRLGKTPYNSSMNYNQERSGWVSPNFLDALHHFLSEYFGPVALAFSAAETPVKPPARAAQPQAGNRNPYRMKQKPVPVVATAVEEVELTPALCALTLETIPAPHGVMKQTYYDIITPRINEFSTNAEKRAAFEPAATHFITKFFIADPHGSIPRYPGSEDSPTEVTIYSTVRRGTPRGLWPKDEWA
jgi:hypothetical protein